MKNNLMYFVSLIVVVVFSGCVRVSGNAAYWTEDDKKNPVAKSVGFDVDSSKLIPATSNQTAQKPYDKSGDPMQYVKK